MTGARVQIPPSPPIITDNIDIVLKKPIIMGFFSSCSVVSRIPAFIDIFKGFPENLRFEPMSKRRHEEFTSYRRFCYSKSLISISSHM